MKDRPNTIIDWAKLNKQDIDYALLDLAKKRIEYNYHKSKDGKKC